MPNQTQERERTRRVYQNISQSEWYELRDYAAKHGLSMSQVLREFSKGAFAELKRGNDPLEK